MPDWKAQLSLIRLNVPAEVLVLTALTEEYVDMIEAGIVDPTKVTRSALQNAASIAAMVLTTESVVADKPAKEGAAPMGGMPMGGGMPGMM